MKRSLPLLLFIAFIVGCGTVFTTFVTLKDVVDVAMADYMDEQVAGHTTPQMDATVRIAYERTQRAAAGAKAALVAYKAGGDQQSYLNALAAARVAVGELVDLIVPLVTQQKAASLKVLQSKAQAP
jgi:hypothetical protein